MKSNPLRVFFLFLVFCFFQPFNDRGHEMHKQKKHFSVSFLLVSQTPNKMTLFRGWEHARTHINKIPKNSFFHFRRRLMFRFDANDKAELASSTNDLSCLMRAALHGLINNIATISSFYLMTMRIVPLSSDEMQLVMLSRIECIPHCMCHRMARWL